MSNLGVNKVILIGNAGQDAEVKSTPKGKSVANFSLAINEGLRARAEKAGPRVVWVRCVAWNKLAEIAGNFVKRGKQVFVEGRLQMRQCRDRDGAERTICEVVVKTLRVVNSGKSDGQGTHDAGCPREAPPDTPSEDVPF
jgi:single-strand DNA-binding protein